jgi:hypothetical protein
MTSSTLLKPLSTQDEELVSGGRTTRTFSGDIIPKISISTPITTNISSIFIGQTAFRSNGGNAAFFSGFTTGNGNQGSFLW